MREVNEMRALIKWISVAMTMALTMFCTSGAVSGGSETVSAAGRITTAADTDRGQAKTQLPNGMWLLTGGESGGAPSGVISVYDPVTGTTNVVGRLTAARAWHSATLLANGKILVFGGIGADGTSLAYPELFDPSSGSDEVVAESDSTPRAHHVATVLTDGTVLLAGGDAGGTGQIWDPTSQTARDVLNLLVVPRNDATATLLASGAVLISGGTTSTGAAAVPAEVYAPSAEGFEPADAQSDWLPTDASLQAAPRATESIPKTGASNVAGTIVPAVRFSEALDVRTLNVSSVTLLGPTGPETVRVVPVEGGRLLFVTPGRELSPGSSYTLAIRGARDVRGLALPLTTVTFSTSAKPQGTASAPSADKFSIQQSTVTVPATVWHPPRYSDPWKRGPLPKAAAAALKAPLPHAPPGATALTGRVLLQDGTPLPGVTVYAGKQRTLTDSAGNFLLSALEAGHIQLIVDGRTANTPAAQYGQFVISADIAAHVTNELGFTVWMPVVDAAHAVSLPSPTTREVKVTSPLLPGVVLKIPAGAVIREPNGQIATSVSLTPIPLDRSPFPTPNFSMYFVIQPGGAIIESSNGRSNIGARLIYPNTHGRPPGSPSQFMYYDPSGAGWTAYGRGRVAPSGDRIDPQGDTLLRSFSGFGDVEAGNPPPAVNPPPNSCHSGGGDAGANGTDADPVDCYTGLFEYSHVDLVVNDTIPIVIHRTYQSSDTYPRNFGIGFRFDYAIWLYTPNGPSDTTFSTLSLVLPNGSLIPFTRTANSPQTGLTGLQMVSSPTPTEFNGATITYDGSAYLIMTTKNGTQYKFNAADGRFLRAIVNRNGQTLQVTASQYQTGENTPIVAVTTPNGRWIQIQYAGAVGSYPTGTSQISRITDNSGRTVSYGYDTSGRLTSVTYPDGGIERYTYVGTTDQIQSIILPNGQTKVTNYYDSNNRVYQQTLADNGVYKFNYTTSGTKVTQTTVTDPNGNVRVLAFNSAGYVTSNTRASGTSLQEVTTYVRDPSTNFVKSMTDALNRTTAYGYDRLGNLNSVTFLSGTSNAVTYSYTYTPTLNELKSIKDPLGHTTQFGYDSYGDLTTVTDALNNKVATIKYNTGTGLPTQVTDALSHTTKFTFQGGDLTAVTDALNRTTNLYVDELGRRVGVEDPSGNRTYYTLDTMDRVSSVTDPLGNVTSLVFDLDGNLKKVTDPRNGVTQYLYDTKDRLTSRIDQLNNSETMKYDYDDNLHSRTDRKGQTQILTYDALNRLNQVQYENSSGAVESAVVYGYDSGNRLTKITDSTNGNITRVYDDLDRLKSETTLNGSVGYQYDTASRRQQLTVSGQTNPVIYGYNADNRLTGITQGSSSVAIKYDTAGRRQMLTFPGGLQLSYGFDNANELTGLTYTQGGTTVGTLTYSYDTAARIIARGGTLDALNVPATVSTANYDAANRLTQWGSSSPSYDLNGNLTGDGSNTYTWNARDQLIRISGAHSQTVTYDGAGRRQSSTVNGSTRALLYDGLNLVQELTGGMPTVNYLTGANIDETFSATTSTGSQNYMTDLLGSTIGLASSAGTIQTGYTYDSYGNTSSTGSSTTNKLQYTGRENDGTGLYYYRARYYSPQLGRFISEDPAGLAVGTNFYAYVHGNPIGYADPYGLFEIPAWVRWGLWPMRAYDAYKFWQSVTYLPPEPYHGFGGAGASGSWEQCRNSPGGGNDANNGHPPAPPWPQLSPDHLINDALMHAILENAASPDSPQATQ